jgi:hypothetical protein
MPFSGLVECGTVLFEIFFFLKDFTNFDIKVHFFVVSLLLFCIFMGMLCYEQGLRDLGCKNYQNTTGTVSVKSLVKKKSLRENHTVASAPSKGGFLKFLLIFGYLTLQGSRPAVAGTDISTALQSIPYLGDLGDISTGFASVRRISLCLL